MNELDIFLRDVHRIPNLTPDEEKALVGRHACGDEAATEQLVLIHLPLVVRIARQHRGRRIDFLDLIQEGVLGLLKATASFDQERSGDLGKYAAKAIRGAIQDAIAEQAGPFRLPIVTAYQARRTETESSRRCAATLEAARRVRAMKPYEIREDDRWASEEALEALLRAERVDRVREVFSNLPSPDRWIAQRRFLDEWTVPEIATKVQQDRQRVKRRLKRLSETIRDRLAAFAD